MAWKKPEPLTQELHIKFAWPFVFNTDIGTGLTFDLYKQDTTFLTVNPVINLNFFMDGMNYIRLYYDYSSSILLNNSGQAEPAPSSIHAGMSSALYGLGLLYRKLDYLYNPRKGFLADINLGIGTRNLTDKEFSEVTDGGEGDHPRSVKFSGRSQLQVFIPAGRSFTLLVQNRSGLVRSDGIFENELFRLGGINSMRGVEENSMLASAYSIFTAEARYLFEQNSSFYLFYDAGYYEKDSPAGFLSDTPIGFGAGISLQSGLGIFTINYAIGQEYDNPINIGRAKIHLGYISRF
jgi:outer membrane protein assembly factor BamA